MGDDQLVAWSEASERRWRLERWSKIKEDDDPRSVSARRIEELGLFPLYYPQGMYACKEGSGQRPPTFEGAMLSVRHDNSVYAEYLSDSEVIYLYPNTKDPDRDKANIISTARAKELRLPVFVIVKWPKTGLLRDVRLGWVIRQDEDAKRFLIAFGEHPLTPNDLDVNADQNFVLFKREPPRVTSRLMRAGAQKFRDEVFNRYGAACAFCNIRVPVLLDATHIVPVEDRGTDHPANGLVLCALHHRAFDAGLVAIDPSDLSLRTKENSPSLMDFRIDRNDLSHLTSKPHPEALDWAYERWLHQEPL